MTAPPPLSPSTAPLLDVHDALLADLDGVVYVGDDPVPKAPESLEAARARGVRICFVTNNAAHTPSDVVDRLSSIGVTASPGEVVTSSMAAADLLRQDLPPGSSVLVVGGKGLWAAVADAGLRPVAAIEDDATPAAVVQGWGPDVAWADLAEAAVAVRRGARWVATNLDRTLPSPRGPLPGSGSLVAAVEMATGHAPGAVAGKPHPPLFTAAVARVAAANPLVVGDRLDTDIAGAGAAGLPSLLVLTGVSTAADLLAAPPESRPTYLGRDLTALELTHPGVSTDGTLHGQGADDGLDGLRTLAVRAWNGEMSPDQYNAALDDLDLS